VKVVVSPAWYDDYVLTVGSVAADGSPSQFSLAGPWVDVAGPGEGVVSLDPDGEGLVDALPTGGEATPISGTSYAAPVVTGIVALVRSRSPELTARQVVARIEETARRPSAGWNPVVGHGLVDALAAISNGTTISSERGERPSRLVPTPAAASTDQRPGQVAMRGAAICLAVSAATVAMTVPAGRLRRSREAVTRD